MYFAPIGKKNNPVPVKFVDIEHKKHLDLMTKLKNEHIETVKIEQQKIMDEFATGKKLKLLEN